jgi:DNA polymerase-3 subunit beta
MNIIKAPQLQIFNALQSVAGIVEKRHTIPILANIFVHKNGEYTELVSSDKELQLRTKLALGGDEETVRITINARKLTDILRTMPSDQIITLSTQANKVVVKGGKSRFTIQTLPGEDFPLIAEAQDFGPTLTLSQKTFKALINQVQFAMAVNDIRYYLNGVLLETDGNFFKMVATDGHRMAFAQTELETPLPLQQVILPRKTVLELQRLLKDAKDDSEDLPISLSFASNQVRFEFSGMEFISKLVEGKFPDYNRVLPKSYDNKIEMSRSGLLASLQRAAILTAEKFKCVRVFLEPGMLKLAATNDDQEEAWEEQEIEYGGSAVELGFNVNYLIDALAGMTHDNIEMSFQDANAGVLFTIPNNTDFKYVVMPMRA